MRATDIGLKAIYGFLRSEAARDGRQSLCGHCIRSDDLGAALDFDIRFINMIVNWAHEIAGCLRGVVSQVESKPGLTPLRWVASSRN
jgi:hypothetical protein